ncbi:hypothetical protein LJC53_03715 [Bacteroidales bacterium OttesenSCG-928-C03]|nr:hypothetical protein [Bacteroidales bacterium OttesenSCG-928-C03]
MDQYDHAATLVAGDSKAGTTYQVVSKVGHLAKDCGNSCVKVGDDYFHIDCMGHGYICEPRTTIIVNPLRNGYYEATTVDEYDLTVEDFYLMPDRSLIISKNNWLNIPEQLVFRDSVSGQFTFTGLYYSGQPAYSNQ